MSKIIRTSPEEVAKYRLVDALNQSRLKLLLKGMDAFIAGYNTSELYYSEKESLVIGSAVDTRLTSTEEDFDNSFYVSRIEKPSDTMMSVIQMVFDKTPSNLRKSLGLYNLQDKIVEAMDAHQYYPKWKEQTRINKVLENVGYFNSLVASEGKQVITADDEDKVDKIVRSLKTSSNTKKFFNDSDATIIFQKPLYFMYKGVKCKALLDIIKLYKDAVGNVLAIEVIDLKTMYAPTIQFPTSLRKFRYDIQAAWYMEAIRANAKNLNLLPSTVIKSFKFVVESTSFTGTPAVYDCLPEILEIGKYGRKAIFADGIKVTPSVIGFDSLVDDYIYYQNQGWLRERRLDERDGVLNLKWDGIQ